MRYDEGAQEGTLVDVTEMYINNSVRRRARVIGETPRQADPEGPSNYPRGLFTMPSWRLLCGGCDRDTASSLRDTEPPSRIDEQSARRSGITLIPAVTAMITKRHADRLVELIVAYAPPIAIWSLSLDRIRYRIKKIPIANDRWNVRLLPRLSSSLLRFFRFLVKSLKRSRVSYLHAARKSPSSRDSVGFAPAETRRVSIWSFCFSWFDDRDRREQTRPSAKVPSATTGVGVGGERRDAAIFDEEDLPMYLGLFDEMTLRCGAIRGRRGPPGIFFSSFAANPFWFCAPAQLATFTNSGFGTLQLSVAYAGCT